MFLINTEYKNMENLTIQQEEKINLKNNKYGNRYFYKLD